MYAYLEGRIASKAANELVIDVNGVGYLLQCSMTTLQNLPQTDEKFRIYTWLSVREDALELFGFATIEEKNMFLRLTSVSGIGPRTALGMLGAMPLRDLSLAIVTGDITALSRAPGIGKKTAQRIVLELKEKVTEDDFASAGTDAPAVSVMKTDAVSEAMEALQALGYTGSEAAKAISKVQSQSDQVDELIRLALRNMAGM